MARLVENIVLGTGWHIDKDAVVGYYPSRDIADYSLMIGPRACVRSKTIIYGGTKIGAGLETGHGAVIREQNLIGENFNIWNNTTVDYGCKIGNNVKIHCNCYIAQFSVIEDDVFIAPGVVFANDLHPLCCSCMKGPTIEKHVRIGVGAIILPGVTIGGKSLVAAGAVVTKDIPPESVVMGNPGRVTKSIYGLECKTGIKTKPYKRENG